jgi:hypothetical protein
MQFTTVNYLAVIVAALATFFIGALWYSPLLFAKHWMKAHGYTEEKLKEMQKTAMPAYVVSLVCYLVMAYVLAMFLGVMNVAGAKGGMWVGFFAWLGFAATIGLTANMFSDKKLSTYIIDAGYQLTYLLVMGAILGAWR